MAYYRICPDCGAALDPGEKCDCREKAEQKMKETELVLEKEKGTGQMVFCWEKERRDA